MADLPKGKSKEEILREEVRFWMDSTLKMMQWGLTLMVSLQTALVFIRRELVTTYITSGIMKAGEELPSGRYFVGTVFLIVAAAILSALTSRSIQQYRHYKVQLLKNSPSGISDQVPSGITKYLVYLYIAFPILDVLFRIWIVKFEINVH